ncbi:MAG: response regulator transcription factor [Saprospiraceae bacterium]
MIQVLLVDDHQIVIDGIRMMLSSEADIACSGSANDGQSAMEQLAKKAVDVVLLDINMPGTDGVETCKNIRKTYPNIKILVLSMLGETSVIRLMLKNGANGYLLKNAGKEEVIKAIRTLYAGERFFDQAWPTSCCRT